MRKLLLLSLAVLLPTLVMARGIAPKAKTDTLDVRVEFSNEYLDSINVIKKIGINDYSTVGVNYGVNFSNQLFNPRIGSQEWPMTWNNVSVMFTRYCKMFDRMPYFGIEFGFEYGHQGFRFRQDPESEYITALAMGTVDNISYITEQSMKVFKVPLRSKFHVDVSILRFMADVGFYGGWRASVVRDGIINDESLRNTFQSYERKFDYGLEGGAGFALLFDPVEFHFNVLAGWSWNSLYEPDSSPSKYNQYYYRYANPIDITVSVGVHFQITKRTGKTSKMLKNEAYRQIYHPDEEDTGKSR